MPTDLDSKRRVNAGRLAGQASLDAVRMTSIRALRHTETGLAGVLSYDLKTSPGVRDNSQEGSFAVVVDFQVQLTVEIAEEQTADLADIELTMEALFSIPEDMDISSTEFEAFTHTSGMMAVFPYARQIIQETTTRLGLPPLTLDLYKA